MTYQEQLSQNEWIEKRLGILDRDGYQCTKCQLERPQFRGLVRSFGILGVQELVAKGYSVNYDASKDITDALSLTINNASSPIKYISDNSAPIDLTRLRITRRCTNVATVFGIKKGCCYIAFYEEDLTGQSLIDLNVHHRYYVSGRMAWEYENDALVSLCFDCHKRVHKNEIIYYYDQLGGRPQQMPVCDKCDGAGYLQEFHYYNAGICFGCWGAGVTMPGPAVTDR